MQNLKVLTEEELQDMKNCLSGSYADYCLSGLDLDGAYVQADFENCDLRSIGTKDSYFYQCTFTNCDFAYAFFEDTNFDEIKFINCSFENALFKGENSGIEDCVFENCEFYNTRGLTFKDTKKTETQAPKKAKLDVNVTHYISPKFETKITKYSYDDIDDDGWGYCWGYKEATPTVTIEFSYGKNAVLQCKNLDAYNELINY